MTLWWLLLALALTATAVAFFTLGASAPTAADKRKKYTIAAVATLATVAIVVAGAVRGRMRQFADPMDEPYVNDMDFDFDDLPILEPVNLTAPAGKSLNSTTILA